MVELAKYFTTIPLEVHLIVMVRHDHFYSLPHDVVLSQPDFVFKNGNRFINTVRTMLFLRRCVTKIRPYSVMSFGEMYNSFVLIALMGLNIRVFVSDRSRPDKRWSRFHELLRVLLYRKAHGIISQTTYASRFIERLINHKNIAVIPNPVTSMAKEVGGRENILLSVGRLINTKRIDLLLDVFSSLDAPNWKLWIVGDGVRRAELEQQTRELNLTERVKFWGNQKDLASFYASAKVFVMTSVSEGFPNVLLEAMSAGLACVAFDCVAGPSDVIETGVNGYLVKVGDKEELKLRLEQLMNDEPHAEAIGRTAQECSEKYSIERIGHQYYKFLFS